VQLGPSAKQSGSGSFAGGQVRRPDGLADVELGGEGDDFGSDVTTGGRGLLESVIGG
jgi:hypothetical protein